LFGKSKSGEPPDLTPQPSRPLVLSMVELRPAAIVMAKKVMFAVAVVSTIVLGTQAQAQEVHPMPTQLCSMAQQLHI
jgi:hypothetical protein